MGQVWHGRLPAAAAPARPPLPPAAPHTGMPLRALTPAAVRGERAGYRQGAHATSSASAGLSAPSSLSLPPPPPNTTSPPPQLHARFEREWTRQRALPGGGSLFRALAPGSGPVLALTAAMHAVGLACQFAQPLILQQIVDALACVATPTKGCPTKSELYPFAGYLAASTVVYNVLSSHERILLTTLGLRTRGSVMAAIYRKTLLLSSGAAQEESAGRIVTLMSNDAQKLQEFLPMVHEVWAAPCLIAASVWLLYSVLSWSTFVGLAVVFLLLPCTAALAGRLFVLRRGLVALADKRVNLLSEMVGGIRVIKFYTWEARGRRRGDEAGAVWDRVAWRMVSTPISHPPPILLNV